MGANGYLRLAWDCASSISSCVVEDSVKATRTSEAELPPLYRSSALVLVACVIAMIAVLGIVDVATDLFNLFLVLLLFFPSLLPLIAVVVVIILPNRL